MPVVNVAELLRLLAGSVVHRPYVYTFLACFVVFATYQLGWRRMLAFLVPTYLVTYACEFSSTRNGFPFGPYRYFDDTRGQELWIANVPFFDSLSFVFLSYFSFIVAAALLGDLPQLRSRLVPWVGGVLMMLLDVVIDPVALQGDKWFLGRIYDYPYRGFYFGVTAANFAGWFFVGVVTQAVFRAILGAMADGEAPLACGRAALRPRRLRRLRRSLSLQSHDDPDHRRSPAGAGQHRRDLGHPVDDRCWPLRPANGNEYEPWYARARKV